MSKTTKKLGKPIFHATISTEAAVTPSPALLASWEALNVASLHKYEKPYDKLDSKQKSDLHFELKVNAEKIKKAKKGK